MNLFKLPNWPLLAVCILMIVCAIVDWWKFKVPNRVTFPVIVSGLCLGLLHTLGIPTLDAGQGGIFSSLAGTALGFVLLYPVWLIGGVGGGDVKMQMGFGAWIGAFFITWQALWIIALSFCVGVLVGGVIGIVMAIFFGNTSEHLANAKGILIDMYIQGSISKIAQKAEERKPRLKRIPYGVPLCIGFVTVLFLLANAKSQPDKDEELAPQDAVSSFNLVPCADDRGEPLRRDQPYGRYNRFPRHNQKS